MRLFLKITYLRRADTVTPNKKCYANVGAYIYYLRVCFDANRPEGELVFVILYADLTPYSLGKTNIRFVLIVRTA